MEGMPFTQAVRNTITSLLAIVLCLGAQAALSGWPAELSPALAGTLKNEAQLGPQLHFENPIYDFGRVAAGQLVHCSFRYSNTGDATLHLQGVPLQCGCTTTGEFKRILRPMETGLLQIQLDTSLFNGRVCKQFSLTSNARTQTNAALQIVGTVWQPVEVFPPHLVFGILGSRYEKTNKTVRIINNSPGAIMLDPPTSNSERFCPQLRTLKPGREFELTVVTVPPLTNGFNQGIIVLNTTSRLKPVLILRAQVFVQPVQVFPPRIVLYGGVIGEPIKRCVIVTNNQRMRLALSDTKINREHVAVTLEETIPGCQFRVDLTFPSHFQILPEERVILSMQTSLPEDPTIEIPILQP
jgi:hypothetical protein